MSRFLDMLETIGTNVLRKVTPERWLDEQEERTPSRSRSSRPSSMSTRSSILHPVSKTTSTAIAPPPSPLEEWRNLDLNHHTLDRMKPSKLIQLMADLSPELSKALWDFLRFCNPGHEMIISTPGDEDMNETYHQMFDELILPVIEHVHSSIDTMYNMAFTSLFLRGALLTEAVFGNGREPTDYVVADPIIWRFKKVNEPSRGSVYIGGLSKRGRFQPVEEETVLYIPLDPLPGLPPYGRAMVLPAVTSALFLIGLLHDLRRVVAQQGYPRLDLEVKMESLIEHMPADLQSDPEATQAWINATITEISDEYALLQPDDAYVHTDAIAVNKPVGTLNQANMSGVDSMITALERMCTRALKSMAILLATGGQESETHANRQWEIYVAGIRGIQEIVQRSFSKTFQLTFENMGVLADVSITFSELRASERLRDAQTETMEIANAISKRDQGWIDNDQASIEITGSPAVGEPTAPEPTIVTDPTQEEPLIINDDGDGADPTEDRRLARAITYMLRNRHLLDDSRGITGRVVGILPNGSDEPLLAEPSEVVLSDDDQDRVNVNWDTDMPDYALLLDASVTGQNIFDDDPIPQSDVESPWVFDARRRIYRNTVTGESVSKRRMRQLRDEFAALIRHRNAVHYRQVNDEMIDKLADGTITIQEFQAELRKQVKDAYHAQYTLARGGRNNMTFADWGRIGRMMAPDGQYRRIAILSQQIKEGTLSTAQIRNRMRQLTTSSTQAFERGRAASYGLRLPTYPADGTQDCKDNCKCEWVIRDTGEVWECYWKLNPAEHCATCEANADRYNPLIITKEEARTLGDVGRILGDTVNHTTDWTEWEVSSLRSDNNGKA